MMKCSTKFCCILGLYPRAGSGGLTVQLGELSAFWPEFSGPNGLLRMSVYIPSYEFVFDLVVPQCTKNCVFKTTEGPLTSLNPADVQFLWDPANLCQSQQVYIIKS